MQGTTHAHAAVNDEYICSDDDLPTQNKKERTFRGFIRKLRRGGAASANTSNGTCVNISIPEKMTDTSVESGEKSHATETSSKHNSKGLTNNITCSDIRNDNSASGNVSSTLASNYPTGSRQSDCQETSHATLAQLKALRRQAQDCLGDNAPVSDLLNLSKELQRRKGSAIVATPANNVACRKNAEVASRWQMNGGELTDTSTLSIGVEDLSWEEEPGAFLRDLFEHQPVASMVNKSVGRELQLESAVTLADLRLSATRSVSVDGESTSTQGNYRLSVGLSESLVETSSGCEGASMADTEEEKPQILSKDEFQYIPTADSANMSERENLGSELKTGPPHQHFVECDETLNQFKYTSRHPVNNRSNELGIFDSKMDSLCKNQSELHGNTSPDEFSVEHHVEKILCQPVSVDNVDDGNCDEANMASNNNLSGLQSPKSESQSENALASLTPTQTSITANYPQELGNQFESHNKDINSTDIMMYAQKHDSQCNESWLEPASNDSSVQTVDSSSGVTTGHDNSSSSNQTTDLHFEDPNSSSSQTHSFECGGTQRNDCYRAERSVDVTMHSTPRTVKGNGDTDDCPSEMKNVDNPSSRNYEIAASPICRDKIIKYSEFDGSVSSACDGDSLHETLATVATPEHSPNIDVYDGVSYYRGSRAPIVEGAVRHDLSVNDFSFSGYFRSHTFSETASHDDNFGNNEIRANSQPGIFDQTSSVNTASVTSQNEGNVCFRVLPRPVSVSFDDDSMFQHVEELELALAKHSARLDSQRSPYYFQHGYESSEPQGTGDFVFKRFWPYPIPQIETVISPTAGRIDDSNKEYSVDGSHSALSHAETALTKYIQNCNTRCETVPPVIMKGCEGFVQHARGGDFDAETLYRFMEKAARFYRKRFVSLPHWNFTGVYQLEPVIVTIGLSNGEQKSQEIPCFLCMIRTIRRVYKGEVRPDELTPSPTVEEICRVAFPKLSIEKLEPVLSDNMDDIRQRLIAVDEHMIRDRFKVVLFHILENQFTQNHILANTAAVDTPSYKKFLNILGEVVPIRCFSGYKGDLEDFRESVYTNFDTKEIMFHVSSMMMTQRPQSEDDIRRLIGTNLVAVVFLERGAHFYPKGFAFQLIHVFIVVQESEKRGPGGCVLYDIRVVSRDSVPWFDPVIPTEPLGAAETRRWILNKIINAEVAMQQSGSLANVARQAREQQIRSAVTEFQSWKETNTSTCVDMRHAVSTFASSCIVDIKSLPLEALCLPKKFTQPLMLDHAVEREVMQFRSPNSSYKKNVPARTLSESKVNRSSAIDRRKHIRDCSEGFHSSSSPALTSSLKTRHSLSTSSLTSESNTGVFVEGRGLNLDHIATLDVHEQVSQLKRLVLSLIDERDTALGHVSDLEQTKHDLMDSNIQLRDEIGHLSKALRDSKESFDRCYSENVRLTRKIADLELELNMPAEV